MNFALALVVFILCFGGMGIGLLLAKKALKKGCGDSPDDCACRRDGKDPDQCDK